MAITKVLMIDDEPDIRKVGLLSLRAVGKWEVTAASSGPEGLELALKERPDVILLDIMMPGMDGPTTLGMLRERPETRSIPVIFLTAKALKHEVERFLAMGVAGIITKPFDPLTLPRAIQSILEKPQGPPAEGKREP